ncbi:EpsI family protein [delta proteobacterium NaphS2]|nr:EpsI family protein [delta proteobacterium NaphS2]
MKNISVGSFLRAAVYALLLLGMYFSTMTYLVVHDWMREDYSYGYMIPFVVLYLIWDKRMRLTGIPSRPSWLGLISVCLALCLFWVGELAGEYFSLYMSFWLMIVGLCWLHLGWSKVKEMGFAFVMMLTMFPFPNFLYTKVSWQLKLVSSQLGVAMMQALGMSAFREGNVIDLGFTQLQVVDACSGLRYLIPLIVLGLLLAYFYKATFWKRAAVVISTVPLSIITNSMRIALTGVVYEQWGAELAEGFFHDFSGWFIFLVSLGALLLEMWALNGFKGIGFRGQGSGIRDQGLGFRGQGTEGGGRRGRLQLQFWIVVVLLGATLGFSHGVEFREKVPISRSLELFPMQVGGWTGTREIMEKRFIDALDLSDYVIVNYRDPSGREVNLYVAYYESQRKGESIHTPGTCLPGSGWLFRKAGRRNVNVKGKPGGFPVNQAVMQKGEHQQVVYYWFPQRGRILTNAYELKFYAFWDAMTRQRTDGALVRLITPVYAGEGPEKAEARLQEFMGEVLPVLTRFIPQ